MYSDTDSECEFVDRMQIVLEKRAAREDNFGARRALRNYGAYLRNDHALRSMRLAQQHTLKQLQMQITQVQYAIARLEERPVTNVELTAALAQPYAHKELLHYVASLRQKNEEALRNDLQKLLIEKDRVLQTYDREYQDIAGETRPLESSEMGLIRGFLAQRKSEKQKMSNRHAAATSDPNGGAVLQKGDAILIGKRAENSLFSAFFEKHQFDPFIELQQKDLKELAAMFRQADVNNSGLIEEDDFSKFVRRLLCDHGVTQAEVDRIAMMCHLSVADGFALNQEAFFVMCSKLLPIVETQGDKFLELESETMEQLKRRQLQAAEDERELFRLEQSAMKAMQVVRSDTSLTLPQQQDQLLDIILQLEVSRYAWAEKATILSVGEQDRLRTRQLGRSRPSTADSSSARDISTSNIAVATSPSATAISSSPRVGSAGRTVSGKTTDDAAAKPPRIPSAPSQRASSGGSSRSQSATSIMETFKNSMRSALHRAPFVEVRSADDIPNEQTERDLYLLFSVFSRQEDFITSEHLLALMNIFTPCGADVDEALNFMREELDDHETLIFDEFIKFGSVIKNRLLAYETFAALPNNKSRHEAIEKRVSGKRGQAPLRRYEKEFLRMAAATQHIAQMQQERKMQKSPPRAITSRQATAEAESLEWTSAGPGSDRQGSAAAKPSASRDSTPQKQKSTPQVSCSAMVVQREPQNAKTEKGVDDATPRQGAPTHSPRTSKRSDILPDRRLPILPFHEPEAPMEKLIVHRKKQDTTLLVSLRRAVLN